VVAPLQAVQLVEIRGRKRHSELGRGDVDNCLYQLRCDVRNR